MRNSVSDEGVDEEAVVTSATARRTLFNIFPLWFEPQSMENERQAYPSQKFHQCISRFLRLFLEHPVAAILQDDHCGVGGHNFHLLPQYFAVCPLAANCQ